ncbi:MAG: hypothetical protein AAGB05_06720 [Pseudomonadota bacterium]
MTGALPSYFFRIRDNGALVFRVADDSRTRRLEFEQIAVVNMRSGEVKPHGGRALTEADDAAITEWIEARQEILARRTLEDVRLCIEQINRTAQWAQSKASEQDLAEVTDTLLLSIHDLRSVLVRKKADALARQEPKPDSDRP